MNPYTQYRSYNQEDDEKLPIGVPNLARIARQAPRLMIHVTRQLDQMSLASTQSGSSASTPDSIHSNAHPLKITKAQTKHQKRQQQLDSFHTWTRDRTYLKQQYCLTPFYIFYADYFTKVPDPMEESDFGRQLKKTYPNHQKRKNDGMYYICVSLLDE
jgi:hypothetical protein